MLTFEIPGAYTPAPGGMKRKARKEGVCYEQNNYSIQLFHRLYRYYGSGQNGRVYGKAEHRLCDQFHDHAKP